MEVLDRPQVAVSELEAEFDRFKGVVASRRLPSDFISLFDKLRVSDRFSDKVKPLGFAYLVEQSAIKVPDHFIEKLLQAIDKSGCAKVLYGCRQTAAEEDFKALVRRLLELTPLTEEAQTAMFRRLEEIGVSRERIATIDMALRAGASMELMDQVCDLTFDTYFPNFYNNLKQSLSLFSAPAKPSTDYGDSDAI